MQGIRILIGVLALLVIGLNLQWSGGQESTRDASSAHIRIHELQMQRAQQIAELGANHPKIRKIDAELQDLRSQLAKSPTETISRAIGKIAYRRIG